MKRVMIFIFAFVLFSLPGVLATACDLDISLINQDPYPAIPGDYVKIVFQVDGIDNPLCGKVDLELLEQYPLVFDEGQKRVYTIESGTFQRDYESFFLASYRVRVDEGALNGDNPIEVRYNFRSNLADETKKFNLDIEDTRADFEVHVKDYDVVTKTITFEILNIAEVDVEALTVEIPKQENIAIKGANRNIVGDLDSNEYTTADFEATPKAGEIKLQLSYSDTINVRRTVEKSVIYEPEYFNGRAADQKRNPVGTWIVIIAIVIIIGYWIYRKKKKKAQRKHRN